MARPFRPKTYGSFVIVIVFVIVLRLACVARFPVKVEAITIKEYES
jgi:hypothetical protein